MRRGMLDETGVTHTFWGEAVQTVIDILNKAHVWVNSDKTPHKLWYGKPTIVRYFRIFGSECFIKKNDEKLGKCESRVALMVLEVDNREWGVPDVKSQLDPTLFGVGSPTGIQSVAKLVVSNTCLGRNEHIIWHMHGFGDRNCMNFVRYWMWCMKGSFTSKGNKWTPWKKETVLS